jgi:two pore calcium channel protein 2
MSDIIVDDPHRGVRESWPERHLLQAIVLLEDAYSFRSIAHKLSPLNVLKLYRLYWSKWIQRLLTFIVSCQLLLIFIQYPSSFSRTSDLRQKQTPLTLPCSIQIIIEFLCLIIFYIDVIIRVKYLHIISKFNFEFV